MIYSEATYFEGYHFAHIAAKEESERRERKAKENREALRSRRK